MHDVVIGTWEGREQWSEWCRFSLLQSGYQGNIHIVKSPHYEVGCLALAAEVVKGDRFLFLQDSFEVTSREFWDYIPEGSSWLFGRPVMYAGVYETEVVRRIIGEYPLSDDKRTAIHRETLFCDHYTRVTGAPSIWPDVTDDTALGEAERFGRNNLVLGNAFVRKWKGTWESGVSKPPLPILE